MQLPERFSARIGEGLSGIANILPQPIRRIPQEWLRDKGQTIGDFIGMGFVYGKALTGGYNMGDASDEEMRIARKFEGYDEDPNSKYYNRGSNLRGAGRAFTNTLKAGVTAAEIMFPQATLPRVVQGALIGTGASALRGAVGGLKGKELLDYSIEGGASGAKNSWFMNYLLPVENAIFSKIAPRIADDALKYSREAVAMGGAEGAAKIMLRSHLMRAIAETPLEGVIFGTMESLDRDTKLFDSIVSNTTSSLATNILWNMAPILGDARKDKTFRKELYYTTKDKLTGLFKNPEFSKEIYKHKGGVSQLDAAAKASAIDKIKAGNTSYVIGPDGKPQYNVAEGADADYEVFKNMAEDNPLRAAIMQKYPNDPRFNPLGNPDMARMQEMRAKGYTTRQIQDIMSGKLGAVEAADYLRKQGIAPTEEVTEPQFATAEQVRRIIADAKKGGTKAVGGFDKVKQLLGQEGGFIDPNAKIGLNDIRSKEQILNTKRTIETKDASGNDIKIPEGEALTPYVMTGDRVLLQDGEQHIVTKNQYKNIKNQSITTDAKPFAPELEGMKVTVLDKNIEFKEPEEYQRLINEANARGDYEEGERLTLEYEAMDLGHETPATGEKDTRYGVEQYTYPGGKDYHEIIVQADPIPKDVTIEPKVYKMPDAEEFKSENEYSVKINGEINDRYRIVEEKMAEPSDTGELKDYVLYRDGQEVDRQLYVQDLLDKIGGDYNDIMHYDGKYPNTLVWVRADMREVNGKKVYFIEEIQSNWFRDKRKGKTEIDTAQLNNAIEIGLKRAMQEAVARGADAIAWTSGKQQQTRYKSDDYFYNNLYDKQIPNIFKKLTGKDISDTNVIPANFDKYKIVGKKKGRNSLRYANMGDQYVTSDDRGYIVSAIKNDDGTTSAATIISLDDLYKIGQDEKFINKFRKRYPEYNSYEFPHELIRKINSEGNGFRLFYSIYADYPDLTKDLTYDYSGASKYSEITPDVKRKIIGEAPELKQPSGREPFKEEPFKEEPVKKESLGKRLLKEEGGFARLPDPEAIGDTLKNIRNRFTKPVADTDAEAIADLINNKVIDTPTVENMIKGGYTPAEIIEYAGKAEQYGDTPGATVYEAIKSDLNRIKGLIRGKDSKNPALDINLVKGDDYGTLKQKVDQLKAAAQELGIDYLKGPGGTPLPEEPIDLEAMDARFTRREGMAPEEQPIEKPVEEPIEKPVQEEVEQQEPETGGREAFKKAGEKLKEGLEEKSIVEEVRDIHSRIRTGEKPFESISEMDDYAAQAIDRARTYFKNAFDIRMKLDQLVESGSYTKKEIYDILTGRQPAPTGQMQEIVKSLRKANDELAYMGFLKESDKYLEGSEGSYKIEDIFSRDLDPLFTKSKFTAAEEKLGMLEHKTNPEWEGEASFTDSFMSRLRQTIHLATREGFEAKSIDLTKQPKDLVDDFTAETKENIAKAKEMARDEKISFEEAKEKVGGPTELKKFDKKIGMFDNIKLPKSLREVMQRATMWLEGSYVGGVEDLGDEYKGMVRDVLMSRYRLGEITDEMVKEFKALYPDGTTSHRAAVFAAEKMGLQKGSSEYYEYMNNVQRNREYYGWGEKQLFGLLKNAANNITVEQPLIKLEKWMSTHDITDPNTKEFVGQVYKDLAEGRKALDSFESAISYIRRMQQLGVIGLNVRTAAVQPFEIVRAAAKYPKEFLQAVVKASTPGLRSKYETYLEDGDFKKYWIGDRQVSPEAMKKITQIVDKTIPKETRKQLVAQLGEEGLSKLEDGGYFLMAKAENWKDRVFLFAAEADGMKKGYSGTKLDEYVFDELREYAHKYSQEDVSRLFKNPSIKMLGMFQQYGVKQAMHMIKNIENITKGGSKGKESIQYMLLLSVFSALAVQAMQKAIGGLDKTDQWKQMLGGGQFGLYNPAVDTAQKGLAYLKTLKAQGNDYERAKALQDLGRSAARNIPFGNQLLNKTGAYASMLPEGVSRTALGNERYRLTGGLENLSKGLLYGEYATPDYYNYYQNEILNKGPKYPYIPPRTATGYTSPYTTLASRRIKGAY